jgi:hypothetical protein
MCTNDAHRTFLLYNTLLINIFYGKHLSPKG